MIEKQIQMVDLQGQYHRLKEEIDAAMQTVIESSVFINGPQVKAFSDHLAKYLDIPYVVPCGNGTDALHLGSTNENSPLASVATPIVVPLIKIATPGKTSPL